MSHVKITDLSSVPFFARFLEGQFSNDLTPEEMKRIRGGMTILPGSDPAPQMHWPDLQELIRQATAALGQLPSLLGLPTARPPGPGPFPVEPGGGIA
jgi:hypothetical protein